MNEQDQNQNNFGKPQPEFVQSPKRNPLNMKPWMVAVSIIVLVLIGVFVWWYIGNQKLGGLSPTESNLTKTPSTQNNDFNVATLKFTDKELGLVFDYPEAWGDTTISVKADSWSLTKKISFAHQPNLYFEIVSPALSSDAQSLQIPSGFTTDLSSYCKQNILGDRSEPLSDVYDIYRLNGSDEFGTCPNNQGNTAAIVYRTDKSVDPGTPPHNVVVPKKDLDKTSGISTLKFSKRYYLRTQNPLYDALIVYQSGIPEIKSQNYCYSTWSTQADPTGYLKTYKCISYKDKPLIDKAFSDFANSEFNKQTELVLNGMKINSVNIENARRDFSSHFSDLAKYQDAKYSYLYPSILVPNRWDRETKFNAVKVVTRESVVQEERKLENCEGPCFAPTLTVAGWDNEKKLLENNPPDGNVNCVEGINGESLCEVKTYGKNKFLIRYTGRFGGEFVIEKTYIIYKNGIRYEITPPELGGQGTDPILFKSIENQFIQRVYEDIAKSFTLL